MIQTELSTKKETIMISHGQHEVIFHDASQSTEYLVEENAHLELFDIAIDTSPFPNRGGEGGVINRGRIVTPSSLPLLGGGHSVSTSTIKIILNGVGAEVELYGLFFGADEETFDLSHEVIHQAPHTKSRMTTRGALGGRAKASYNGNIRIAKGMAGCDGRQETRTLLLSREAHIDAVPHLEIGNNDVACAHSVSVSYIDEVKKFYCESRGLSEAEAVRAIVQGHFADILDHLPEEQLKIEIENKIEEKL